MVVSDNVVDVTIFAFRRKVWVNKWLQNIRVADLSRLSSVRVFILLVRMCVIVLKKLNNLV